MYAHEFSCGVAGFLFVFALKIQLYVLLIIYIYDLVC